MILSVMHLSQSVDLDQFGVELGRENKILDGRTSQLPLFWLQRPEDRRAPRLMLGMGAP